MTVIWIDTTRNDTQSDADCSIVLWTGRWFKKNSKNFVKGYYD